MKKTYVIYQADLESIPEAMRGILLERLLDRALQSVDRARFSLAKAEENRDDLELIIKNFYRI